MHLDGRLICRKDMKKKDDISLKYTEFHWLLGRNSKLSLDNNLFIYKTMLERVLQIGFFKYLGESGVIQI